MATAPCVSWSPQIRICDEEKGGRERLLGCYGKKKAGHMGRPVYITFGTALGNIYATPLYSAKPIFSATGVVAIIGLPLDSPQAAPTGTFLRRQAVDGADDVLLFSFFPSSKQTI